MKKNTLAGWLLTEKVLENKVGQTLDKPSRGNGDVSYSVRQGDSEMMARERNSFFKSALFAKTAISFVHGFDEAYRIQGHTFN